MSTILCLENGKTLAESLTEITYAASFISWFAAEAPRAYGDTIPSQTPNTMVMTLKDPIGVCGIITPWNFPAAMITRKDRSSAWCRVCSRDQAALRDTLYGAFVGQVSSPGWVPLKSGAGCSNERPQRGE